MSIFFCLHSRIIFRNSGRFRADVPVMPSSAKIPAMVHSPVGHDLVGVVVLLRLIAGELLLVISGYPAVGSHAKLALDRLPACDLRLCGYGDDFGRAFSCCFTPSQLLDRFLA